MKQRDTVLISGGGISGLTLACALRQHDIPVELVERKAELSDDGGVGLTLVGNALRALDAIGLARPLVEVGMPADHILIATPEGRVVSQAPTTGPWGPGLPGHCGIARAALHRVLVDHARQRGVRMRAGISVEQTTAQGDGVDVVLSDGTSGRYRLCVAAEGLNSQARKRLFPDVRPVHAGQGAWRTWVPRPRELTTTQIHFGGRYGVVGICPISHDDAYLYIVEAADADHWEDEAVLHQSMRERLQGHYGGLVAELLQHLIDPTLVNYRPIPALLAPAPWYRDGVVLIGDSVHANPPVLAQGAAMGIEDAVVLAAELARADTAQALDQFMHRRFERVRMVVETSQQLARWEVEHRKDVDVPGTMRQAALLLQQPI